MLLKLLNLDVLCTCFVADFHSCGWSSSSNWGIYSLSPGWIAWLQSDVSYAFDVLFPPWRTSQLILTQLWGSLFFQSFMQLAIHEVLPSPKLMHLAALCALSLLTWELELLLIYCCAWITVQRKRWLTGGGSTELLDTKLIFPSQYISCNALGTCRSWS